MEILVTIISNIAFRCFWGSMTKRMSEKKGYMGGFGWGFWLGLIGVIVVAMKRDNNGYDTVGAEHDSDYWSRLSDTARDSSRDPSKWKCVCGASNPNSLDYCTSCRRTRAESESKTSA